MITKKLNERRKRKYEIRLRDRSQKVYLSEGNQKSFRVLKKPFKICGTNALAFIIRSM